MREKGRVLCIDDSRVIQRLVELRLRADGFDVLCSNGAVEGIQKAIDYRPDVILMDVDMPEVDGYEATRRLKNEPATKNIPIIFITAQAKTDDKVKGLDLGALDYVAKPFDPVELRARVRSAHRIKFLLELLEQSAQIDGLTGLYNRRYLDNRLKEELERARRYRHDLAVAILDVDRFKSINDTYGHSFGDIVLGEVGATLQSMSRGTDIVARYGGEEFVVILPEQDLRRAAHVAERVRQAIEAIEVAHNGHRVPISASLGVASTEEVGSDCPKLLVESADKALYSAKQSGRNRVHVWNGVEPAPALLAQATV